MARPASALVASTALLGCAATGADGWVAGRPEALLHSSTTVVAEARFILRDGTEVTLVKPRRRDRHVVGTSVSACRGPGCEAIHQTRSLASVTVRWMSARYDSLALAQQVGAQIQARDQAQSASERAGPRPVDIVVSVGGMSPTSSDAYRGGFAGGLEARVASRVGLGVAAAFRGGGNVELGTGALSPWMSFAVGDLMALYRRVFATGRAPWGGVSVTAGVTWMNLRWHPGRGDSCGLISLFCTPPPWTPPEAAFESGQRVGVVVGLSFELRWPWFVLGLDGTWRAALTGEDTVHLLTVGVHAGPSF